MEIGLCMTVKNEELNIPDCLGSIHDLFSQIAIVDTGSSDRTCEVLSDHLGIVPIKAQLDVSECLALATHRNRGFEVLETPWILSLDADERIDRRELEDLLKLEDRDLPAGLFCGWHTDFGDGRMVEDYKLSLFRRGFPKRGLIHDTVQPSLRRAGAVAIWTDLFQLKHYPERHRASEKEARYTQRLDCALEREPNWLRYQWFAGYRHYRQGNYLQAEKMLRPLHDGRPNMFPVESLNASMILAAIHAIREERSEALDILTNALNYHEEVVNDFEVKVNFRLEPWLKMAWNNAVTDQTHLVVPYDFPY